MNISVVIPLYNEEESLKELFLWIKKVADASNLSYEVIFVDDGSTDGSWKVIDALSKERSIDGFHLTHSLKKYEYI